MEDKWEYKKVDISLIDDAESNANVMTEEMFNALCDNIGMSGMSSVPACYLRADGRYTIISGHHRLKACRKLGYKTIGILWTDERNLTQDEIIGLQVSHNSVHGEDNKAILKALFEKIKSVEFKKFAHVTIDEIGTMQANQMSIVPVKACYTVSLILYSDAEESFGELIGDIREMAGKSDCVILADENPNEDLYLRMNKELRDTLNIKSSSVAFTTILKMAREQLKGMGYDLDNNDKN